MGFVNTSLCSNYGNYLHDSAVSIKLNLLLTMMWFLYVVELARAHVFGWILWLSDRQSIVIDDEIDYNPGRVLKNIDYRLAIDYQIQSIIDPSISNQLSMVYRFKPMIDFIDW